VDLGQWSYVYPPVGYKRRRRKEKEEEEEEEEDQNIKK
jgi:hypothetical protein